MGHSGGRGVLAERCHGPRAGASAETVEFVGGLFAANANIKQTQESLDEALSRLRFKRVNYKWMPNAPQYTYYTLSTPADGVVQAP